MKKEESFEELKTRHQELARRLLGPEASVADWNDFLNAVLPYNDNIPGNRLAYKYKHMVEDKCSAAVDCMNFQSFFGQYVTFWNSYALTMVLRNHTHFFTKGFKNVVRDAYKLFLAIYHKSVIEQNTIMKGDPWTWDTNNDLDDQDSSEYDDDFNEWSPSDIDEVEQAENVIKTKKSQAVQGKRNRYPYGETLDAIPQETINELWQSSQIDTFCLMLRGRLSLDEEYVGKLFHCQGSAVRQRYGRLFEKMWQGNQDALYNADGCSLTEELEKWLAFQACLEFSSLNGRDDSEYESAEDGFEEYSCYLHFPYNCTPIAERFIIIECRDSDGRLLSGTAILHYGDLKLPIEDGVSEISVEDWQNVLCKNSHCVMKLFYSRQFCTLYPVLTNGLPPRRVVNDDLIRHWKGRKVQKEELGRFIVAFGKELAWLLNDRLDYARYGAPKGIRHIHLQAKPYEAWMLLGKDEDGEPASLDASNAMLLANGVMLPMEWRLPDEWYSDNTDSVLLPEGLVQLAKLVRNKYHVGRKGEYKPGIEMAKNCLTGKSGDSQWCLYPSNRFFHDNVDFSAGTLFGVEYKKVSSAFLTLLVALIHAENKGYCTGKGLFASAGYEEQQDAFAPVGCLEKKILVATDYGADKFTICRAQLQIALDALEKARQILHKDLELASVLESDVWKGAYATAYDFISVLGDDGHNHLYDSSDGENKARRGDLLRELSAEVNRHWREGGEELQAFLHLCGKPGMGKSVLMADLFARFNRTNKAIGFACIAGERDSCAKFIRSIAAQLAVCFAEFAQLLCPRLKSLDMPSQLSLSEAENWYLKLVIEPLRQLNLPQSEKIYLLVDGLDEDDSSLILELLVNAKFALPDNFALIVSSRPLPSICERLKTRFNFGSKIDLDDKKHHRECSNALAQYITHRFYADERIRGWEFARIDGDALINTIASKDDSFIYAQAVLQGIAEKQYTFDKLAEELPMGVHEYYRTSFKSRFVDGQYDVVRPLLNILVGGRLKIEEASDRLLKDGVKTSIWKLMELLRGYCVLYENDEIGLSDATLREWLLDQRENPEFSL